MSVTSTQDNGVNEYTMPVSLMDVLQPKEAVNNLLYRAGAKTHFQEDILLELAFWSSSSMVDAIERYPIFDNPYCLKLQRNLEVIWLYLDAIVPHRKSREVNQHYLKNIMSAPLFSFFTTLPATGLDEVKNLLITTLMTACQSTKRIDKYYQLEICAKRMRAACGYKKILDSKSDDDTDTSLNLEQARQIIRLYRMSNAFDELEDGARLLRDSLSSDDEINLRQVLDKIIIACEFMPADLNLSSEMRFENLNSDEDIPFQISTVSSVSSVRGSDDRDSFIHSVETGDLVDIEPDDTGYQVGLSPPEESYPESFENHINIVSSQSRRWIQMDEAGLKNNASLFNQNERKWLTEFLHKKILTGTAKEKVTCYCLIMGICLDEKPENILSIPIGDTETAKIHVDGKILRTAAAYPNGFRPPVPLQDWYLKNVASYYVELPAIAKLAIDNCVHKTKNETYTLISSISIGEISKLLDEARAKSDRIIYNKFKSQLRRFVYAETGDKPLSYFLFCHDEDVPPTQAFYKSIPVTELQKKYKSLASSYFEP